MSMLSANFNGMSGLDILGHVFDGKMTREVAQHLEVSANGYGEFVNNNYHPEPKKRSRPPSFKGAKRD